MSFFGACFNLAVFLGRPFGGLRPRRMYHWLAHRAFKTPEFNWVEDRWGCKFFLSPFYHLDREIIAFGTFEPPIQNFIQRELRPGMTALDVGANIGSVTLHMARRVSPGGRVLAFEPAPTVLARLREHVEKNGLEDVISIQPLALANEDGELDFAFADGSVENQGMGSLVNRDNTVVNKQTRVAVRRLDDLMDGLNLQRCDLIKIDAQGSEFHLLSGARIFLERFKPALLIEVSPEDLAKAGTGPRALFELIESADYEIYEFGAGPAEMRILAKDTSDSFQANAVLCRPAKPR